MSNHTLTQLFALFLALVLIAGCGNNESSAAPERGGPPGIGGMGQPVGVVTEAARDEEFVNEIEALGTARANEAVSIMSKVSNLVTQIRFREGEQVRRGDILVQLDNVEAAAELMAARAALSESQSQLDRSRELFATNALSQSQMDQLEATLSANQARVTTAQSRLNDTTIRAPFDGRVGLRNVSVGSLLSAGTVITTLDDTRIIKLDFAVPESFVAVLKEGLPLTASSVAFPNRQFAGKVASVDSRVDPTTRSVVVRASVPNPDGALKPGMFLTVKMRQDRERIVMIPEQALVPEEGRQFVFVAEGERAAKREVAIGRRKPGRVEIIRGLAAGDRVIVEGTQKVRDGGAIRDVTEDAEAPPSAPAGP
jgi:membrane fusion protein, multidrug efflux system